MQPLASGLVDDERRAFVGVLDGAEHLEVVTIRKSGLRENESSVRRIMGERQQPLCITFSVTVSVALTIIATATALMRFAR